MTRRPRAAAGTGASDSLPPVQQAAGKSQTASQRKSRGGRGRPRRTLKVAAVVLIAAVAVGALIWLGQPSGSNMPPITAAYSGKVMGDPNATSIIEEYGDFQCVACRTYALGPGRQLEESIVAQGQAKLIWHDMAFLGPESFWAAEGASCASDQGRFWDYHHKLYSEQGAPNSGAFSKPNLKRYASDVKLDRTQFDACLDGGKYIAQIVADTRAAQQRGVNSTPTLFINDQKVVGGISVDQVRQIISTTRPATKTGG